MPNRKFSKLAIGAAAVGGAAWLLRDVRSQIGSRPLSTTPERAERVRKSPQFRDGSFVNPVPRSQAPSRPPLRMLRELTKERPHRHPAGRIPLVTPKFANEPTTGVAATWLGHSTVLVEIEGRRVLVDPVWSDRVSPSRLVGPRRLHPTPVSLVDLPPVDAVVISHDHYDHLDQATIQMLNLISHAQFLVPLGVGGHLQQWGVDPERIVELDWEDETRVAGLRFVATAAQHFSGRSLARNDTLWASWVIAGENHRVFYAGDSGYFPGFRDIGAAHGPFELTLMPVGAYNDAWPDIHMTPEQAVDAHLDVGGELLLAVHWATYTLATHPWSEPVERLWREAKARGVSITVPRPGETIETANSVALDGWWKTLAPMSEV